MGRRFRSYGLSVSRACASHTLSTAAEYVQQPVSSCVGSPPRRFRQGLNERSHSTAGHRSRVCFTERRSQQRRLRACIIERRAPRCIFRCIASTHAALHKLRRIVVSTSPALSRVSFESLRQHALLSTVRSHCTLHHRASLSTDSFFSCRFNESCGSDACTVS